MNDEQPATPQTAEPVWPERVNYGSPGVGMAYSNGWNECLSDCKRAYAEAATPQQPAVASAGASADAMYRGKCPDGDRCVHGCHANERCHLGATKPGDDIRMSPQQFEWWQNQSAAWMAVADALQKHWSPAALSGGTNGTTSATGLIKMLCEEAKAYRAAGHRAALQSPPVATAQQSARLHGFEREDLEAIAVDLETHPNKFSIGDVTGEGEEFLQTTEAAAARFIRAALATTPAHRKATAMKLCANGFSQHPGPCAVWCGDDRTCPAAPENLRKIKAPSVVPEAAHPSAQQSEAPK